MLLLQVSLFLLEYLGKFLYAVERYFVDPFNYERKGEEKKTRKNKLNSKNVHFLFAFHFSGDFIFGM